jgi:hypothetical protein
MLGTDSTSFKVTGNTRGDKVLPFLVTVTVVNGTEEVTKAQVGNVNNALRLNIPATRSASTLMTTTITIDGYYMKGVSYKLLDVDASSNSAPYTSWQDKLVLLEGPTTATAVDSNTVLVSGNTLLARRGNVASNATNGNVDVTGAAIYRNIKVSFGPGSGDGLGSNQLFGYSNITIQQMVLLPEPDTLEYAAVGIVACAIGGIGRRKRRVRAADTSDKSESRAG